jgi:hypothetical protein
MKNILICGAGKWQISLIDFFLNQNCNVYLVTPELYDLNKVPFERQFVFDLRETEEILIHLSKINIVFEFATSDQSDLGIYLASKINSFFKYNGINEFTTNCFCNKFTSNLLTKYIEKNVSKIQYTVDFSYDINDIKSQVPLNQKLVLKPDMSQSSKGIHLLNSINDLTIDKIEYTLGFSKNFAIIEEFLIGKEYTFESIVIDSKLYPITASKKDHFFFGVANSLLYSDANLEFLINIGVSDFFSKYIKLSGFKNGFLHAELIVNDNKEFKLVEVACRGGGTNISSLILSTIINKSSYECLWNFKSNIERKLDTNYDKTHCIELFFFKLKNNHNLIHKSEIINNLIGVLKFEIEVYDFNIEIIDDRSRHGYAIIKSANIEDNVILKNKIINILNDK